MKYRQAVRVPVSPPSEWENVSPVTLAELESSVVMEKAACDKFDYFLGEHPTREQTHKVAVAIADWLRDIAAVGADPDKTPHRIRAAPPPDLLNALAEAISHHKFFSVRPRGPHKIPVERAP